MFSFDKRMIYIVLGILVLSGIANYLANPSALLGLVLSIPGVLIAITFHEFAHGFAAYKLGDRTAKDQGRLNLNPLSHMDPIGTFMLLFAGFGWGKPVQVNSRNYTRKFTVDQCDAIVSIAGPIANIILAFIFAIIYYAIYKFAAGFAITYAGGITMTIIAAIIITNVGLGIFNLIPLPPLDGSKVIMPFLPFNVKMWFRNNEQIFYIIFVVIFISGVAGWIISPAIEAVTNGISYLAALIMGVNI